MLRRAQPVALAVVVAGRLDVAGERGVEAREAGPDRLEPDLVRPPDGHQRRVLQSGRGAVHDERARRQRNRRRRSRTISRVGHVLDVAEADDVLDGAEQVELPRAERRRLGHRRE